MRRLFISISAVLFLFACAPHLSVRQITTKNISVNSQTSSIDSSVQSIIRPYKDSIEHDMSKLVAVSATLLKKDKPESNLTNLIADILLKYGTEYCKLNNLNMIPNASYVNYGGLRASLPKGEITVGHIFELMPFENGIVLIKNDFSDTILAGHVKTHHILKKGGVKIGIYGLGIELDGLVGKLNYGNTRYSDPLETAIRMESMLKKDHSCDLVICLSHLGFSYAHHKISDTILTSQTKYTDLIVHSQSSVKFPVSIQEFDIKSINH